MPETIKHVPMRKCIACSGRFPQSELIRITYNGSELKIDEKVKSPGRACYLCGNSQCMEVAIKKNLFARSFRKSISREEIAEIGRYLDAK